MGTRPTFAHLRTTAAPLLESEAVAKSALATRVAAITGPGVRQANREGRKQVAGFFSPEMSLALHTLARRNGIKLQELMAEAFNDVLRKHGESPIGD